MSGEAGCPCSFKSLDTSLRSKRSLRYCPGGLMFEQFLHNHTRTVVDGEGRQVTVKATCAEVNHLIGSHIATVLVPDGNGGEKLSHQVVSCADVESELTRLRTAETDLTADVGRLNGQVA